MNPFDAPPVAPAVSYEPPRPPKRRRGRMIGAAVVGAGLVGAGAIGASVLASDDGPDEDAAPALSGTEAEAATVDDVVANAPSTSGEPLEPWMSELDEDDLRVVQECLGLPEIWTDAPFLGEEFDPEELPALEDLFGEFEGEFPALEELFGEFEGEFPALEELFGGDLTLEDLFSEFEGELLFEDQTVDGASVWSEFGDVGTLLDDLDGLVAVMGPDGPIVLDLGDGDGSVTIERDGDSGEVTVTTEGDAAVVELDSLLEDLIVPLVPDDLQECLDGLGAVEG